MNCVNCLEGRINAPTWSPGKLSKLSSLLFCYCCPLSLTWPFLRLCFLELWSEDLSQPFSMIETLWNHCTIQFFQWIVHKHRGCELYDIAWEVGFMCQLGALGRMFELPFLFHCFLLLLPFPDPCFTSSEVCWCCCCYCYCYCCYYYCYYHYHCYYSNSNSITASFGGVDSVHSPSIVC